MRTIRVAVVAVAALLAAGCSIQPDGAPRDIAEDHPARADLGDAPAAGGAARGSERIFLIAPGDQENYRLRTVLRETEGQPDELIDALVQGPNTGEVEDGYRSAIPSTVEVNGVRVNDGVVEIDIGDDLDTLSSGDRINAVAQLVFTASEIPNAEGVLIRVNGARQAWPDGSGRESTDALTVYDFIGFAENSQPPYPVTPTPTTAVPPSTTSTTTTTVAPTTVAPTTTAPAAPAPTTAAAPTTVAPPAPTTPTTTLPT